VISTGLKSGPFSKAVGRFTTLEFIAHSKLGLQETQQKVQRASSCLVVTSMMKIMAM
jgi:hypothetical protein